MVKKLLFETVRAPAKAAADACNGIAQQAAAKTTFEVRGNCGHENGGGEAEKFGDKMEILNF